MSRAFVKETDADPAAGLLSWTSPVAQTLLGRERGDEFVLQGREVRIAELAVDD